jgi:hypothetical protein
MNDFQKEFLKNYGLSFRCQSKSDNTFPLSVILGEYFPVDSHVVLCFAFAALKFNTPDAALQAL